MHRTRRLLTFFFLLSSLFASSVWSKTAEDIYTIASPSVVMLYSNDAKAGSQGSGVVIERGEVITNCHVIIGKTVVIGEGKQYPAKVHYADKVRDLCQLTVAGLPNPAVRIAKDAPRIGQKVYAIGNPKGLDRTLSDGLISSIREMEEGYPMLQISAPITFGSSGGGLFNENGEMAGITTKGYSAANLNFALPASLIPALAATSRVAPAPRSEAVAELANTIRPALSLEAGSAPPKVRIDDIDQRIRYLEWLGNMSAKLKERLPNRQVRIEFLGTLWYESKRAALAPDLVLGVVEVSSGFRKYYVSRSGARGYMAVPVEWTEKIGDGDPDKLFQMKTNLRYGCSILRLFVDEEKGDLFLALGRFGGKRGRPEYPDKVQAAWKKFAFSPASKS